MAVTSVQILHATDVERRAKFLRKIITYRIVVNSQTDGPDTIYASASIPTVDVSGYASPFKYGTDTDNASLICREVRNLRKVVKWNGFVSVWQIDAEFIYDRDQTLADKGVTVKPLTRVESQIISSAEFKSFWKVKASPTLGIEDRFDEDTTINESDPADANTTPILRKNKIGPITNSAGTPIVPALEQPIGKSGLIVSWTKITPIDYTPFIYTTNSGNVTITDTHGAFNTTYTAGRLRLINAEQTPRDYFSLRVVDVSLEFDFPEYAGDHFELDRGLAEYLQGGDDDGKGGTYSNTDLPLNGMRALVGADGQPISQPIPFNGKAKAIQNFEPPKARWLRYKLKPATNFSGLGIGVYT